MNLKLSERFWKIIFRIQNRLKSNRFHKLLLSLPTTVFIVVAKVSFVRAQSTKFFTGKISQMFDKNPDKIYFIKNCLQNENNISCGDYKSDTLNKSVEIPVTNLSENMLKLKKGQRLAEITIAECAEKNLLKIITCSNNSSPIIPVKKRDGSIRLCCDFRKLNAKTIPKSFEKFFSKAENIVDDMNEADVFTVGD